LERNQWQTVDLPLNESTSREVELVLEVNPTRNPARSHLSTDDRDLGVMVRRIQIADE
jgi:hypothetical protein